MNQIDHRLSAKDALESAEHGLIETDPDRAGVLYAQIGIGHALLHVAEVLDAMQDDLKAIDARLRDLGDD